MESVVLRLAKWLIVGAFIACVAMEIMQMRQWDDIPHVFTVVFFMGMGFSRAHQWLMGMARLAFNDAKIGYWS